VAGDFVSVRILVQARAFAENLSSTR
jgi:hypothetical protein